MNRPQFNVSNNHSDTQIQKAVREVFQEFCSNSTIHGVQYFSKNKRHWTERCWWMIAISVSLWFCGQSVINIWMKRHRNPVILSFTEKNAPISDIPFPTITICPETKTYQRELDVTAACRVLFDGGNLSDIEFLQMRALAHICQFALLDSVAFQEPFTNGSIYSIIEQMAPTLNDTLLGCMWQYSLGRCSDLFVPILTEEGVCFAFNALNSHEIYTTEMTSDLMTVNGNLNVSHWSFEDGYDEKADDEAYPIRVFNARHEAALVIFLRLHEKDLEYLCRGSIQGFKVILHTPGQILKTLRHTFRVPLSDAAEIWITPKLITTSDELRSYAPNERKCFFSTERRLRFFRMYTQYNCEAECLANFTQMQCGCVKFSMPRETSTRICGASKIECYQSAEKKLFGEDVIDGLKDKSAKLFREQCNCLPACTSIVYDAEIDRTPLNWAASLESYKFPVENFKGMKASSVTIFFRDHDVVTLKRSERYSFTDFLAICGGLFGLFLGVSALSIIEFLYYLTLRLYLTLRQWKIQNTVVPYKRTPINSVIIDIPNP